ncbi:MAG: LysR family transcriptional regulator [Proteobacteria bacterium]|nr:LysR family transcriptional regulator [Pseudomonadota bacterium]
MNLRQLEAFHEVMLTGSVTKAARNMGRTQPAVSMLVAGLEADIGYELFERRNGRMQPVPEAQYLFEEARGILDRMAGLRRNMLGKATPDAGHLRIACMPIHAEYLMPEFISRFVRDRDDVTISLISQSSLIVYELLASQQFDIGFAEVVSESALVDASIVEMDCVCGVPADGPLAGKSVITPADLDGQPMACLLPEHFIRQRLQNLFDADGRELNIRFETQNVASQYTFIENGLACAVMSPMSRRVYRMARASSDRIAFVPFRPSVTYSVSVLVPNNKPLSRLALGFVKALIGEVEAIARDG